MFFRRHFSDCNLEFDLIGAATSQIVSADFLSSPFGNTGRPFKRAVPLLELTARYEALAIIRCYLDLPGQDSETHNDPPWLNMKLNNIPGPESEIHDAYKWILPIRDTDDAHWHNRGGRNNGG